MSILQEKYSPESACFGCGPKNPKGLRIRSEEPAVGSLALATEVTASWTPEPHHEAFPGVVNGGIIGALLDCHSNWTAAWALMVNRGDSQPACTVTANYAVKLLRPTPSGQPLELRAHAVEITGDRAVIEATLISGGKVCASCRGTFVAVKPGHPAYHRW